MSISISISVTQNESHIYIFLGVTALVSMALLGSMSAHSQIEVQAVSDLSIKISTHEDEIERGETQKISVTVSDKDDRDVKITDAKVKLTVYPPESDSTTADDKTNNDGEANFKVKIDDDAELGTYDIKIKVSKSGYDTKTKESSFDVVGSSSTGEDDNDRSNDSNDNNGGSNDKKGAKDSNNNDDDAGDDNDDNKGNDKEQIVSQGNACGNGLLSTNILCQNVANQLQGDGNAINIIAIQTGGNEEPNMGMGGSSSGGSYGGHVSNPSPSPSSSSSSSSSSSLPSFSDTSDGHDLTSSLSNDESLASIVEEYKQARINEAIELRLKYLNVW
ncbi:MAG TPA: hypothetical protein VE130_07095 [Nitrososphaeraceae archaeon]|nr:hypothetical protein [Nitrososphaeraceae archaeon]